MNTLDFNQLLIFEIITKDLKTKKYSIFHRISKIDRLHDISFTSFYSASVGIFKDKFYCFKSRENVLIIDFKGNLILISDVYRYTVYFTKELFKYTSKEERREKYNILKENYCAFEEIKSKNVITEVVKNDDLESVIGKMNNVLLNNL